MNAKRYFLKLISVNVALLFFGSVHASEFSVVSTEMHKVGNTYELSAQLAYDLSTEVNEALENGIAVVLALDVEILNKRNFLWAQKIKSIKQRFRLRYHALSEQYLVKNINTGERTFYKILNDALYNLEHVIDFPVFDASLLEPDKNYVARLRASLDIQALPVPLRYIAYFSSGWNLNSGWYSWALSVKP